MGVTDPDVSSVERGGDGSGLAEASEAISASAANALGISVGEGARSDPPSGPGPPPPCDRVGAAGVHSRLSAQLQSDDADELPAEPVDEALGLEAQLLARSSAGEPPRPSPSAAGSLSGRPPSASIALEAARAQWARGAISAGARSWLARAGASRAQRE